MRSKRTNGSRGFAQGAQGTLIPAWLVWAVALVLVLGGLGSFGILDNNEGLYAEIPREMLVSGDWHHWIIPHLNGLPYMEKPPLLYWLTAISFLVFGQTEWAARLVPALSSLSCVGLLIWFGARTGRSQAGRLAALMFVSGLGVTAMSHVLMFDMLLAALLGAALMFAFLSMKEGGGALLRMSYACLAFAVLAKGVVAPVLFGLVVSAYAVAGKDSMRNLLRWLDPWGLLIFLAIVAPWHIAASLTEPIFAWFYFVNEHLLRFMGLREPHDYYSGQWWYYLPRMLIYLFPWSFFPLAVFASPVREGRGADADLRRFLFLAWLMPLLFFTLSSAKANYYLVAVMPFAAFHLADVLTGRSLRPVALALPGMAIGMLAIAMAVVLKVRGLGGERSVVVLGMEQGRFAIVFACGVALLGLLAALLCWRSRRTGLLAYLLLPAWTSCCLLATMQAMEPLVSTRTLAGYLRQHLPGATVYLYRNFEEQSSLAFYLRHPVPVVDSRSNDLFWGNRLRGNDIIFSQEHFLAALERQPRREVAIVVMQRHRRDVESSPLAERFSRRASIGETTVFHH